MNTEDMIVPEEAPAQQQEVVIAPAPGELEGALLANAEPAESDTDTNDGTSDQAEDANDAANGTEPSVADEAAAAAAQDTPAQSPRVEQVADPGEVFTPKNDYSFDITLADGTVFKITKPEDIEQLPPDADFGTPANMLKTQTYLNKMTLGIDQEKREWESQKATFEQQQTEAKELEQRVSTMVAEIDYLEQKGKLPAVDPKYENANWSDPEIAKQPGIKERIELLNYRDAENKQRAELGLSPMSVLEAHLQMQNDAAVQAAEARKKQDGEARKARGAMVGGSGASTVPSTPEGYMIGTVQDPRSINNYI